MISSIVIIALTGFVGLSLLHRSVLLGLVNILVALAFWGSVWITYLAFRA